MTSRPYSTLAVLLMSVATGIATGAPAATTPAPPEDFAYHAEPGDTLIGLGRRLMRDPRQWPAVQSLNHVADPRRIPRGSVLRIPYAWLKMVPEPATVVAVAGSVTVAGRTLAKGDSLAEGSQVTTGGDGSVTLRLPDGSTATVQKSSVLELHAMQRVAGAPGYDIRLELHAGRISTQVRPHRDVGRFEIHTPVAISAVRGTEFRTSFVPDGTVGTSETLDGSVDVAGPAGGVAVGAGFGTRVERDLPPIAPVALLPAPDLSAVPAVSEAREIVWSFAPVPGATRYRLQLARDERFEAVMLDLESSQPQIEVPELADGKYCLRVRGIDHLSLEGRDGLHCFTQHALPPAPTLTAPAAEARSIGERTLLEWQAVPLAAAYRVEIARTADFAQPVSVQTGAGATRFEAEHLAPGRVFWRVATVDASGSPGHWSARSSFLQVAAPPEPAAPAVGSHQIAINWPGSADTRYVLQVARDPAFSRIAAEQSVTGPAATLARPMPGAYYARVRVEGPQEAATGYGPARRFEVPMPLWAKLLVSALLVSPFL